MPFNINIKRITEYAIEAHLGIGVSSIINLLKPGLMAEPKGFSRAGYLAFAGNIFFTGCCVLGDALISRCRKGCKKGIDVPYALSNLEIAATLTVGSAIGLVEHMRASERDAIGLAPSLILYSVHLAGACFTGKVIGENIAAAAAKRASHLKIS